MLVPSTFTGWYRKMMMKAEIASEINRSRSQMPKPVRRRKGLARTTGSATEARARGAFISPAEFGPETVSGMPALLYTEPVEGAASCMRPLGQDRGGSAKARHDRLQWQHRGISNDTPTVAKHDRLSQPDVGLSFCGNSDHVGPMVFASGRWRRTGIQCGTA